MEQVFVEVSDEANWAKILLMKFGSEDLLVRSKVSGDFLLKSVDNNRRVKTGTNAEKVFVLDLQTEEGAFFFPRKEGNAKDDLESHEIWVCPLYLPFLIWLYANMPKELKEIPKLVEFPKSTHVHYQGWRRPGPEFPEIGAIRETILQELKTTEKVPETLVEMMIFTMEKAGKAKPLLMTYLHSLSERERNRWIGALMSDSKRYITQNMGTGVGLIPR